MFPFTSVPSSILQHIQQNFGTRKIRNVALTCKRRHVSNGKELKFMEASSQSETSLNEDFKNQQILRSPFQLAKTVSAFLHTYDNEN